MSSLPFGEDEDISSGNFKFNSAQGVEEVNFEGLKAGSETGSGKADIICDDVSTCTSSTSIVIIAFKEEAENIEVKDNSKSKQEGEISK